MKQLTLYILTTLLIIGCQPTESEKTVIVGDKYSLSIPSFLTESHNLNEDASLQYQHAWKEFYVIAIDETKEEFKNALDENELNDSYSNDINGYANLLLDNFQNSMNISQKSDLANTTISELNAKIVQVTGKVDGIDAYFSLAFIEGSKRYYQIMTWTLSSKKHQYSEKMDKLIHSFKEL